MKQSLLVAALLAVALSTFGKRPGVPGVVTAAEPPMTDDNSPGSPFPNLIGDPDIEALFEAELVAAGISPIRTPVRMGESRARIIGIINEAGWTFIREHNYWRAEGPGLPQLYAQALFARHGQDARLDGDASGKDPAALNGFGATRYHVDTPAALAALATSLRQVVASR